jgi:hypothetical protein
MAKGERGPTCAFFPGILIQMAKLGLGGLPPASHMYTIDHSLCGLSKEALERIRECPCQKVPSTSA